MSAPHSARTPEFEHPGRCVGRRRRGWKVSLMNVTGCLWLLSCGERGPADSSEPRPRVERPGGHAEAGSAAPEGASGVGDAASGRGIAEPEGPAASPRDGGTRSTPRDAATPAPKGDARAPESPFDAASEDRPPRWGEPCDGYTLISNSINDTNSVLFAKLIDMDGNVVQSWDLTGFPAKFLPGGSVIGCMGVFPGSYDCIEMQQVDWEGRVEWTFSNWVQQPDGTTAARQHHDFQRAGNPVGSYAPGQSFVPEGNTLVLAHENRSVPELRDGAIEDDVIYEIDWAGEPTGFVWYGADHAHEFGFDEAALNDIRTREPNASRLEWLHGNSISRLGRNRWYDEGREEFHPSNIIYSSRAASFVAILAHDTGEVVWRVGPDFRGRPEEAIGQFAGQHNPYLIPEGLPGAGNVLVFDNGAPSGYGGTSTTGLTNRWRGETSRVVEFDPTTFELVWEYGKTEGDESFYSYLISNAQRLPNGNTLITIGMEGRLLEVTPDHDVVWEFQATPDESPIDSARVYRAYRVPPEWLPEGENERFAAYPSWASLYER